MKKKLLLLGGLTIMLVLGYWLFLSTAPGFFKVRLPVMSYVQNFEFIDQDGKPITEKTFDGKVYVSEYFFTTCTGICPKMNANMAKVYNKFRDSSNFAIISHTSMPETDSIPLLKDYEEKMLGKAPAHPAKWYFVTGDRDSLYKMARQSYQLDDPANYVDNPDDDFIHTQFFALVDQDKRVRGIYDGLKSDEMADLERDILRLMAE